MSPKDARTIAEIQAELIKASGSVLARLCAELEHDDRAGVRAAVSAAITRENSRIAEGKRLSRLYRLEEDLRRSGAYLVAGVDEVGRGALAGPLSVGACILPAKPRIIGLDDSKRLSPQKRELLAERIREVAVGWAVAHVGPAELDSLGMTAALRLAMGRAVSSLELDVDHVVVDGNPVRVWERETAVVGGDGKVAAIAAASILAKVTRDAMMVEMSETYPLYDFHVNKGYGSPDHLTALARHGTCEQHRQSFTIAGGTQRLF